MYTSTDIVEDALLNTNSHIDVCVCLLSLSIASTVVIIRVHFVIPGASIITRSHIHCLSYCVLSTLLSFRTC